VADRPAARPPSSLLRRVLRWALGLLAVTLLLGVLWQQRHELADALARLDIGPVLLSGVFVLLGLIASMMGWRALLGSVGHRLPVLTSARLYFLTQIGKYLPGSVWPVVAQMELGREEGVPASRSGVAGALSLLVGIATGIVIGVLSLVAVNGSPGDYWWLLIPLPILVVLLRPAVGQRAVALLLRLARRPAPDLQIDPRGVLVSAGWSAVMWLCFGIHVYVLVAALGGSDAFVRSVGAYALAWVAGFLVFFAPAGAGARELTLVVLLTPVLERPEALAVAVVSRVLSVAGDLVVAVCGIAAEKWHRHARPEPEQLPG
jgi:uncharacterized membrane protein YbhN (UPF0104 family)